MSSENKVVSLRQECHCLGAFCGKWTFVTSVTSVFFLGGCLRQGLDLKIFPPQHPGIWLPTKESMGLSWINESSWYEDVSRDMLGRIRTGRADFTKTRTKNHSFLTGYYLDHRSLTW